MTRFRHAARQALTVARRDFTATVLTPTFLLFLLSPLLMIGFGVIGSLSATTAATGGDAKRRIVVIADSREAQVVQAVDRRLRTIFSDPSVRPELRIDMPAGDRSAQARKLLASDGIDVAAVLYGPFDRPHILRAPSATVEAGYLEQLAEQVVRAERTGTAPLSRADVQVVQRGQLTTSGRSQAAYFAAFGIFFLTLMLSGQVVGAMAEERSNKVIEVLAAAVPLESVFFGKLIGAFGSALLFVCFWGTLVANVPRFLPEGMAAEVGEIGTAVGPVFALLFVAYFTMAYMLQSAVFLGMGALAGTQREIQMLSLPITVFQFGMLGLASYAAGHPDAWLATFAEMFPFSSPLAMAARAANAPEIWPHLLALAWQALWVGITVTIAARLFRRGVLKSGGPRRRKAAAAA
ncbi:ABC transporter permease [Sphingomonas xinjiangensis]|uniref:ABC-2 type transport system permease protein n=1 Tax=Sphingomonas xinjiangensis TaxID=643568 RepID=A0A840YCR5_9SPHN|nr:ABC transporter permease [Sphingomonas xinjiangensis]MBB5709799.1 ABC-2 type transport system permease protein [Sphingomonas xinjiangensis]